MTDDAEPEILTDAKSVYWAALDLMSMKMGTSMLLDNEGVSDFQGLLTRHGWAPHKVGTGIDWRLNGWTLFLRAQEGAKTIVHFGRDQREWCTRCADYKIWDGTPLKCSACGWLNRWQPREPLSTFGGPEVDRTTTGARLRPGS